MNQLISIPFNESLNLLIMPLNYIWPENFINIAANIFTSHASREKTPWMLYPSLTCLCPNISTGLFHRLKKTYLVVRVAIMYFPSPRGEEFLKWIQERRMVEGTPSWNVGDSQTTLALVLNGGIGHCPKQLQNSALFAPDHPAEREFHWFFFFF